MLLEAFRIGRSRGDQESAKISFDLIADQRMLEDALLKCPERGKETAAEVALLLRLLRLQFLRAVISRMEEREHHKDHAHIAEAARHHAEIILAGAEKVASDQFRTDLFSNGGKNQ